MIELKIRHELSESKLHEWGLLSATGKDIMSFFQGQITNDLTVLKEKNGFLSARLNRSGKVQSFFFVGKDQEVLWVLCPLELINDLKDDLEKYIIMEDVSLKIQNDELWIVFNPFLLNISAPSLFDFNFYGVPARLQLCSSGARSTDPLELEKLRILNGFPQWNKDVDHHQFINDSLLNEYAVSYKKGCFLGQETVAKIQNNRGAAYYPVLFELEKSEDLGPLMGKNFVVKDLHETKNAGVVLYQVEQFLQIRLIRDLRVIGKKLTIEIAGRSIIGRIRNIPMFAQTRKEIAHELFHMGVALFQKGMIGEAKDHLLRSLAFDPELADAYESLGVIFGRENNFEEAISWMDKLLEVRPDSIMAHTNKSLFLMRLGRIEEAEKEKSIATISSFAHFGEEAKLKKQLEEEAKKKEADRAKREKMFIQVLELDPEDSIALYGMADIFFTRGQFDTAIRNLEQVLEHSPSFSTAYLLLGKCYEAQHQNEKAMAIYQKGILAASKKGDMMPANEMQSRMNQLS